VEKQLEKNVQGLRFKFDGSALDAQFPPHFVEFVFGKPPEAARIPVNFCC
jgi:hypothetical protein